MNAQTKIRGAVHVTNERRQIIPLSAKIAAVVQLPLLAEEGEEPPTYSIPLGATQLVLQNRIAGDWYVEITGPKKIVSAFHAEQGDALVAAIEKLAA